MAKPQIVKLMVDGVLVNFLVRVDKNGEWACYSKPADGGRAFFVSPKGVDEDCKEVEISLAAHVKRRNAANCEKPVLPTRLRTRPITSSRRGWPRMARKKPMPMTCAG